MRNQAYYDSVIDSMAKKPAKPALSKSGSGFGMVGLLVLIATAIISLLFGSADKARDNGSRE